MKKFLLLFPCFLSFNSFSQELNWKPISENYSIAVISENKNELMSDSDSLHLEYYELNPAIDFNLKDYNHSEINYNLTKNELNEKIEKNLPFYKNSEYAIKFHQIQDSISFGIFFNDSISQSEFENLKSNLEKNFGKENVHFTSKEEAKNLFIQETGADESFFLNNPISASFKVEIKNSNENQQIIENFKNNFESKHYVEKFFVDGIVEFNLLLRIKT